MSDKTVKIEYQFIGEDVGLTTKIDDIYKKLDKLGEGASVTIKKLDGLNKETITLTNNLGSNSSQMNVFSSEMKEMQREIAQATAEVNRLNEALERQKSLMNSTGNKGTGFSQQQLNQLSQLIKDSSKAMANLSNVQKKLKTTATDFSGSPKIKLMEKDVNSLNSQLKETKKLSNELSNNLSKKTYRPTGKTISDVKNTKANTKAIQQETKAIEQNTKAKETNARKITNPNIQRNDNLRYKSDGDVITWNAITSLPKLAQKYPEFKELEDNLKSKEAMVKQYSDKISKLTSKINSYNPHNSNGVSATEISKLKEQREQLYKEVSPYKTELHKARISTYRKMNEMDYKRYVGENAPAKYIAPTKKRRTLNQNTSGINKETKAIEQNTEAVKKNYQVIGDLSKAKGKTLKIETGASQIGEETKKLNTISSQLQSKYTELQNAVKSGNTAQIGTLKNEVQSLMTQYKALERLKGKTLTTKYKNGLQTVDAKTNTNTNNTNTVNSINEEVKAQQSLNNLKNEELKIRQQIAQQEAKTAKQNQKNIKEQAKIEEKKTEEAKKRVDYYTESNKKKQEYQKQQAYDKKTKQLPNNLKNLTNAYKKANAQIEAEDKNLKKVNQTLNETLKKGALKEDDFKKVEKLIDSQNKRILNATASVDRANQKALESLTVGRQKLYELKNLKLTTPDNKSKVYRLTDKQKATVSSVSDIKGYKTLAKDMNTLNKEMQKTESNLKSLKQNFNSVTQDVLKAKNSIGSIGNITQKAGQSIINLGNRISTIGSKMVGIGQNIQMVTNSLRMLSMVATGVFSYAGQQGIEFNRSLMGVSATLNRMEVDKKTGEVSVIDDSTFDDILKELSTTAREQARNSIYDANQIMEAYRITSLAGWSADEMMNAMPSFIDMATVSRVEGENFAQIIDLITDSLTSLNMAYEGIDIDGDGVFDEKVRKDSANLAKEVERLNDVMVKSANLSTMDVDELAESYKTAGSQLSTFGLEVEEISALFSVLANRGIKGSQAGTGLSSIMANLTGKTGQAKKALDEIKELTGIDVYAWDKKGQYIGIDKHLDNLSQAFKKLKEMYGTEYGVDNIQLAQMLGGKHHFKTLAKLLEGYQSGEYTEVLAMLQNSSGETYKSARITEESTWAQTKMALSEMKEAMLSLWDVIEPIYLDILDVIKVISKAFTELSDEQKLNIAKWGALLVVGTSVLSFLGMLAITIGSLLPVIGAVVGVIGKVILVLGTLISSMAGLNGLSAFFLSMSPAISGVITKLGVLKNAILSINFIKLAGYFLLIKTLGRVKDAFVDATHSSNGFFDFLKNFSNNIALQFNDVGVDIGKKIIKLFKIDDNTLYNIVSGSFETVIKTIKHFKKMLKLALSPVSFNLEWLGNLFDIDIFKNLKSKLDKMFDTKGIDEFADYVREKLGRHKGTKISNLLVSDLDEQAQAEGYENYEDKKSNERKESLKKIVTTVFDGEKTEAFSSLLQKIEEAKNGRVALTVEDLQSDAMSYRLLQNTFKNTEEEIITLKTNIEIDENKVQQYNKQIQAIREKLQAPNLKKKDKDSLEAQLKDLTTKRDAQFELKIKNEEELESKLEDYTKQETKLITIENEYKNAGLENELDYESRKSMFEKEYGVKLVFADYDKDVDNLLKLQEKLPAMERELELKLDTTTDPKEYNEIYMTLEKIKEMKTTIPVALELMNEEKVIVNAENELKGLEAQKLKLEAEINKITIAKGLKPEDLTGRDKKAYENAFAELTTVKDKIDTNKTNIENSQNKIKTINNGDFSSVYAMWQDMYSNYDTPLIKLFSEDELSILKKLMGDNNPLGDKKLPTKEEMQQKVDNFSLMDYVNNKTQASKENKTSTENKTSKETKTDVPSTNIDKNTSSTKENTKAKEENKKASEEQAKAYQEVNDKAGDIDGIEEKAKKTLEGVGGNSGELVQQIKDVASAISEMDFGSIEGAMATMLVVVGEVRESLSNIAGFCVNTGLNSFNTMGEGLKTKITEARELLTNMFGYINNTGLNSFNNMTSGLQEKLDEIKTSLSTLGQGVDTSGLSGLGNALKSSLEEARTSLLNICGVAVNRGTNTLTSMGDSLTSAIGRARTALLNVCGVARNSGVSAFSAMGNALLNAISSAKTTVAGISSQINTIKLNASTIKIPTPAFASLTPPSLSDIQGVNNAVRSINNNTSNTSTVNNSNFNFNMKGIMSNNRKDIKDTAKQLTIYCKRKGL